METAPLSTVKKELNQLTQPELVEICLRLSRYKRENKELLAYLLFDSDNELNFIQKVKSDIDFQFSTLHVHNYYLAKKGLRKILKSITKYIKFSGSKLTEIELLLHFSYCIKAKKLHNTGNSLLNKLFEQQGIKISKALEKLHEDLQYDYKKEIERIFYTPN